MIFYDSCIAHKLEGPLSRDALQNLKFYKYSSVDRSPISNYILRHYVWISSTLGSHTHQAIVERLCEIIAIMVGTKSSDITRISMYLGQYWSGRYIRAGPRWACMESEMSLVISD